MGNDTPTPMTRWTPKRLREARRVQIRSMLQRVRAHTFDGDKAAQLLEPILWATDAGG